MGNNLWRNLGIFFLMLILVLVSLFIPYEMTGESWGYWTFAKFLKESGSFIVMDRSPLYTIYLGLFNWMSFPLSVIFEYIVTSMIVCSSIFVFSRKYLNKKMAFFSSVVWLPFLYFGEPIVQRLGIACAFFALSLRVSDSSKYNLGLSYLLLGVAFLFRNSYLVLLCVFIAWDVFKLIINSILRNNKDRNNVIASFSPLILIAILVLIFTSFQSDHTWNNVYGVNTDWFPGNEKSLTSSAFFQTYNFQYLRKNNIGDSDFYLSNQELFGGKENVIAAVLHNPEFVIKNMIYQFSLLPVMLGNLTVLSLLNYLPVSAPILIGILFVLGIILGILLIIYIYVYKNRKIPKIFRNDSVWIFLLAHILIVLAIPVLTDPKVRHMVIMVPIFIIFSIAIGCELKDYLNKKSGKSVFYSSLSAFSIVLVFLLLSNSVFVWGSLGSNVVNGIQNQNLGILQRNTPTSMTSSFDNVNRLIKNCNGLLSFEHKFIAAFADIPAENVYDLWQLPPFGKYQNVAILKPEIIDCVMMSHTLMDIEFGGSTNAKLRYDLHIRPYAESLKKMGAKTYTVPRYGKIVVLS